MNKVRNKGFHILLVDRFPVARWGMRKIIELAGIPVSDIKESGSLDEALFALPQTAPTLVLMGGIDDATPSKVAETVGIRENCAVVLLATGDALEAIKFMDAGGHGFAAEDASIEDVIDVVVRVAQEHATISPSILRLIQNSVNTPVEVASEHSLS
ncbi:MAG: hypothetical protein ABFD54_01005 [Armatimonadota bacterium]